METYLDNAASTKVKDIVLGEFITIAKTIYGNPSSEHGEGYVAEGCIEYHRDNIADFLHCNSDDVFFTSGATMSNQLLIQGFVYSIP